MPLHNISDCWSIIAAKQPYATHKSWEKHLLRNLVQHMFIWKTFCKTTSLEHEKFHRFFWSVLPCFDFTISAQIRFGQLELEKLKKIWKKLTDAVFNITVSKDVKCSINPFRFNLVRDRKLNDLYFNGETTYCENTVILSTRVRKDWGRNKFWTGHHHW